MIDKGEVNKIMTNSFSEYAMLYDKIMLQTSSNAQMDDSCIQQGVVG